jgi:hypothetical protein
LAFQSGSGVARAAATGNEAKAKLIGTVDADTFAEACEKLMAEPPYNDGNFNPEHLTYWSCRLFDNEADARNAFG